MARLGGGDKTTKTHRYSRKVPIKATGESAENRTLLARSEKSIPLKRDVSYMSDINIEVFRHRLKCFRECFRPTSEKINETSHRKLFLEQIQIIHSNKLG